MSSLLAIGGSLAIFGAIAFAAFHLAKKRREALEKFYRGRGFEFDAGPVSPNALGVGTLALFDKRGGSLRNVGKSGQSNKSFFIADYSYTTGSGKNRKRHQLTVACRHGQSNLPCFTLAPEDIFSKIAQAVGYDDIDISHDPEFSKRFVLRGEKPDDVRRVFHAGVLNFIKTQPNMRVECGPTGVVWSVSGHIPPEKLAPFISEAQSFFDLLGA